MPAKITVRIARTIKYVAKKPTYAHGFPTGSHCPNHAQAKSAAKYVRPKPSTRVV